MSSVCMRVGELASRRSQAQMAPFSSPATTLASPCPKQARQRYERVEVAGEIIKQPGDSIPEANVPI